MKKNKEVLKLSKRVSVDIAIAEWEKLSRWLQETEKSDSDFLKTSIDYYMYRLEYQRGAALFAVRVHAIVSSST